MVRCELREWRSGPLQESDRPTVEWLTTQLWGAPEVVVHDGVFYPADPARLHRGARRAASRAS